MAMHPDMVARWVSEHQRELLHDAERDRLADLARGDRSGLGTRLLQRVGTALSAAGRALVRRGKTPAGVPEVPRTLVSN